MKPLLIKSAAPPTVEIDPSAWSAYIRFKRQARVAKTVPVETQRAIATIDLDKDDEVIGVELVGVKEFSVAVLLQFIRRIPVKAPNIDWNRARFITAGTSELQEA